MVDLYSEKRFPEVRDFLDIIQLFNSGIDQTLTLEKYNPPITFSNKAYENIKALGLTFEILEEIITLMNPLQYGDVAYKLSMIPQPLMIKDRKIIVHPDILTLQNSDYGNCVGLSKALALRISSTFSNIDLNGCNFIISEVKCPEFPKGGHFVLSIGRHQFSGSRVILDNNHAILLDPALRRIRTYGEENISPGNVCKNAMPVSSEVFHYEKLSSFNIKQFSFKNIDISFFNVIGCSFNRRLFYALHNVIIQDEHATGNILPVLRIYVESSDHFITIIYNKFTGNFEVLNDQKLMLSENEWVEVYGLLKILSSFKYLHSNEADTEASLTYKFPDFIGDGHDEL